MYYYEVAPTQIIRKDSQSFTYASKTELEIGTIIAIEVGRKNITGVVLEEVEEPPYKTKEVNQVIEQTALPPQLIELSKWISLYYATHLALVLQLLLPRGLQKKRRISEGTVVSPIRKRTKIVFNKHQSSALNVISNVNNGTFLLHGITGSGKTAVYIELAHKAIDRGQSVIVLVPEIALTPQIVDEFASHFKNVYLTHSHQSEAKRHTIWKKVLDDKSPKVVIGPRSALFLPVEDVGLIVIDEAHEPSFKQEQSPRYSALRVASILGKAHGAKVVMGSATPSMVDYYVADKAPQPIVTLPTTARNSVTPDVNLVDMTNRKNFTKHKFLSDTLLMNLEKTLLSGNQALVFHNRRGSASVTLCDNCGWHALCQRCFIPLTLHGDMFELLCHICGHKEKVPTSCPLCSNSPVIHKGIGTKIIESELARIFPKAKIARFDGDSENDNTLDVRYKDLYEGSVDIIIGTQTVAKGLDLPKLRMVGIVQADTGLSLPDFSAPERTFQLLAQAVGRVGRNKHKTSVIVQSFQPNHPAITQGLSGDYQTFYEQEIKARKKAHFPPFVFLLRLTCIYKSEASAIKNAKIMASHLRSSLPKSVEIMGPTPAFYERQRETYRWQLVLKSKKRADLLTAIKHLPSDHWQFELDPVSLL